MLVDRSELMTLLRCPRTGLALHSNVDSLSCSDDDCPCDYKVVNGFPLVVNFENSIFKREDLDSLTSVVKRKSYTGFKNALRSIVATPHSVTAENFKSLRSLLERSPGPYRVLVVGGGTIGQGMDELYRLKQYKLISFDIYASPNAHFVADAHDIPLPDGYFDAVIVQAVLEHVIEPNVVVSEIYRVLKTSGLVYSETPFMQHVHEGAYDFTRFTEVGHRYLFKKFQLVKAGALSGAGTQLQWSLEYFFRGLFRSNRLGKVVKLSLFWLQYFDRLIPLPYNIDAASGVFFLGRKSAVELTKADIVAHYQGAQ